MRALAAALGCAQGMLVASNDDCASLLIGIRCELRRSARRWARSRIASTMSRVPGGRAMRYRRTAFVGPLAHNHSRARERAGVALPGYFR